MKEVIRVRCIRHVYPDRTEVSLCGLGFSVRAGDRIAVLGPNGSGKTTLLSHIVGLLKPLEGEVRVLGLDPVERFGTLRKHVGVVFQNVEEQIIGPTVWDDVCFSPRSYGYDRKTVNDMARSAMELVGITGIGNKVVHYLSCGEKKRVAIAGAMVMRPELLVLDEPFDGLDPKSKEDIISLLTRVNQEAGTTILFTTHDMNVVPKLALSACILNKGQITATGSACEVLSNIECLREANLEPPPLIELFDSLAKQGLQVEPPATMEHALKQIIQIASLH